MKQIDWSKAPEGATHYSPAKPHYYAAWWQLDGEKVVQAWVLDRDGEAVHFNSPRMSAATREMLIQRPSEWSGEGLPPVGASCQVRNDAGGWDAVDEVLAHTEINGAAVAVFKRDGRVFLSPVDSFRPALPPEQLAAAERDRIIHQMLDDLNPVGHTPGYTYQLVNCLYDAGYRKAGGAA